MRNITKGVVNGTRMIVTLVDPGLKFIKAKLLSESGSRQREVLITLHRCTIQSGAFTPIICSSTATSRFYPSIHELSRDKI